MFQFFEMETYIFPYNNETDVRQTAMRKNHHYEQLYTFWSKLFIMEIIPYVTIIVLNAFIVIKIYESLKFRGRFDRTQVETESRRRCSDDASSIRQELDSISVQARMARPRAR